MRTPLLLAYGAIGQLARSAAAIAPHGEAKWQRSLAARRGIRSRFKAWARHRDRDRRLLWMHAPSVGEGLQARVILELVRQRRPDVQLAYTFFSPSAESFARSLDVDFADYLPFDTRGDARAVLDALRPDALVFSKLDVWPVLAEEASSRGVRLGMVSGTMSESSSRTSSFATALLHDCYERLDAVGAISEADAERIAHLGTPMSHISVTGDTRYDQAWARAQSVDRAGDLLGQFDSRPTLVAGSTWPSDEEVLFEAWPIVKHDVPEARLVIAPHEPTAAHLEPIERWAQERHLTCARLTSAGAPGADVVLVDRVGVLGELYAIATAAFVGGGFHSAGLHSVLEPAAYGVPVAFGPRHANSRDATLLHRSRGGDSVATVDETIEVLVHWLSDPAARDAAGTAALGVVQRGLGAAERSWELVMRLVEPPARPT